MPFTRRRRIVPNRRILQARSTPTGVDKWSRIQTLVPHPITAGLSPLGSREGLSDSLWCRFGVGHGRARVRNLGSGERFGVGSKFPRNIKIRNNARCVNILQAARPSNPPPLRQTFLLPFDCNRPSGPRSLSASAWRVFRARPAAVAGDLVSSRPAARTDLLGSGYAGLGSTIPW